ncbi:CLUMA_CG020225, isoform A [Clunio marinus]|uniref:CLUMA_CG020225, isoform A n=1 Tax=Clunio marinus TaxID=568069 RepID=A0A1J1J4A7_9DIPT|nr:CLUMA_CG020225, isoform A [Clunio marinus]
MTGNMEKYNPEERISNMGARSSQQDKAGASKNIVTNLFLSSLFWIYFSDLIKLYRNMYLTAVGDLIFGAIGGEKKLRHPIIIIMINT